MIVLETFSIQCFFRPASELRSLDLQFKDIKAVKARETYK
jgi:hypothetical protein